MPKNCEIQKRQANGGINTTRGGETRTISIKVDIEKLDAGSVEDLTVLALFSLPAYTEIIHKGFRFGSKLFKRVDGVTTAPQFKVGVEGSTSTDAIPVIGSEVFAANVLTGSTAYKVNTSSKQAVTGGVTISGVDRVYYLYIPNAVTEGILTIWVTISDYTPIRG